LSAGGQKALIAMSGGVMIPAQVDDLSPE